MHSTPPFPIIPDMPHGVAYAVAAYKSLPIAKHNSPRVPTLLLCTRPHRFCGNKEATSVRRRSPSHMWAVSWKGRKKRTDAAARHSVANHQILNTHEKSRLLSHTHHSQSINNSKDVNISSGTTALLYTWTTAHTFSQHDLSSYARVILESREPSPTIVCS